jgi:hypothetical protein
MRVSDNIALVLPVLFIDFQSFTSAMIVTRNFLRYTFHDVISSRFKANLTHTADAASVASALYFNQLECFSSFFSLKSEVTFLTDGFLRFTWNVDKNRWLAG